jgi:hypothetical protein
MMESQHKAMLRRLVAGEFNEMAERLAAPHYEPGVLATGQTGPKAVNVTTNPGAKGAPAKAPARPIPPPPSKPAPPPPVWQPAPPAASPSPSRRMPGSPLPPTTRAAPPPRPAPAPPRIAPTARPQPKPAPRAPVQNIFADTERPVEAPHEDLPTLFAEELISEKSLDEVILAFLSADLEPK